jgi:hypothetical protein
MMAHPFPESPAPEKLRELSDSGQAPRLHMPADFRDFCRIAISAPKECHSPSGNDYHAGFGDLQSPRSSLRAE